MPDEINKKPVDTIGAGCFSGREELKRIMLPDSIESMKNKAFYGCKNLTFVTIPKNLSHLGRNCFAQCEKLSNGEAWDKVRKQIQ